MTIIMALAAVFLFLVWMFVCNEITSLDRKQLIHFVFRQAQWEQLMLRYDAVSYERHLFYRITFRNPKRLYDASLWPALEGKSK